MPAGLSAIAALLLGDGIELEEPSKGSHWKLRKPGCRVFPVPAHNGRKSEIGDEYIRALCRHFEIEPQEFYRKLRS